MKRTFLTIFAVVFLFGFTAMLGACGGDADNDADDDTAVVDEADVETPAEEPAADFTAITEYYTSTCAVCHGANGEGNEALKAPALTGADADGEAFKTTILGGREGTTMAAFPDADVDMLVKYFKEGLGK